MTDKCEFCKNSFIAAFAIGALFLFINFMSLLVEMGEYMPCWEAHSDKVVLGACKKWEKKHASQ